MNVAENWESQWGARYDFETLKDTHVRDALNDIELQGPHPLIVDLGCGQYPVANMIKPREGFIPFVAYVDIAAEEPNLLSRTTVRIDPMAATSDTSVLIRGDVDQMALGSPDGRIASSPLRKFLAKHSPDGKPLADLTILSEILNYVHYERTLHYADKLTRPGGTMFIVNEIQRGHGLLFSPNGAYSDQLIADILEYDLGYNYTLKQVTRDPDLSIRGITTILTATKPGQA